MQDKTREELTATPGLEDAVMLAARAHRGQMDKGGHPYILHPLRLMLGLTLELDRMAAVLHDVVEDAGITLEDLRRQGYPEPVISALDCLTRRKGETYEAFIQRLKPNPLARRVKLADLRDNMDLRRIPNPQTRDLERLERYRKAWEELGGGSL